MFYWVLNTPLGLLVFVFLSPRHCKLCTQVQNNSKEVLFKPIQDGTFRGCSRMKRTKKTSPLSKICHTYPTMVKLGTVIPYVKKIQKIYNHLTHILSSADISIFLPEISKFCYIKKYRYRLYVDTVFLILLTFFES